MKKVISVLLCGMLVISMSGCNKEYENNTKNNNNIEVKEDTKKTTAIEKNLGEEIKHDFVTMTIDKLEVTDKYEFSYTEKTSYGKRTQNASINPKNGFKIVSLKGKLTNKTSDEVYTSNNPVYGEVIINGKNYKTTLRCFDVEHAESFFTIVPEQEVDYFLYAEIPTNVADNIDTLEVKFGFVNNMNRNVFVKSIEDLDYLYEIKDIDSKK